MSLLSLKKLSIKNFRNLEERVLDFSPGINCIFGENGNGKTNLLEAIFLITQKKSFRKNTSFPQFISLNGDNPEILFQSLFETTNEKIAFSGKIENKKSEFFLNGRPSKKRVDAKTVFINPFDSYHFFSTPSFRRTWIDSHIGLIDPVYKSKLNRFTIGLRQRNALLTDKPSHFKDQITAIDKELSENSSFLIRARLNFLNTMSELFTETFKKLFAEEHDLKLNYKSTLPDYSEEAIFNFLQKNLENDLIIGHTKYGIHRDDYMLLFDDLNAFEICSLGQQKMSFLSLLFAYIELFKYKFKAYPIVLIDDVSGELDKRRWANLVSYLEDRNFQVFITTANEDFRDELEKLIGVRKFLIHEGKFKEQASGSVQTT